MEITYIQTHALMDIPSASGIEVCPEGTFVVGDDSPFLYQLGNDFQVVETIRINQTAVMPADGRIPKSDKLDIEAMCVRHTDQGSELFLFGSGSKRPERDTMVQVGLSPQRPIYRYDMSTFYTRIRKAAGLKEKDFNLEGAVIYADTLYLFNRGKNLMIWCSLDELLLHLREGAICPQPRISEVWLPDLESRQAGFSGATLLPGTATVLFTASVEHTEDWIADGEVAGSFVGMLDLPFDPAGRIVPVCRPVLGADGQLLQAKIESVAISQVPAPDQYHLLLVIDNDDGHSGLVEAVLSVAKSR